MDKIILIVIKSVYEGEKITYNLKIEKVWWENYWLPQWHSNVDTNQVRLVLVLVLPNDNVGTQG